MYVYCGTIDILYGSFFWYCSGIPDSRTQSRRSIVWYLSVFVWGMASWTVLLRAFYWYWHYDEATQSYIRCLLFHKHKAHISNHYCSKSLRFVYHECIICSIIDSWLDPTRVQSNPGWGQPGLEWTRVDLNPGSPQPGLTLTRVHPNPGWPQPRFGLTRNHSWLDWTRVDLNPG